MPCSWSTLFAAKCRHHVFLRTVAHGDEPVTNTAVAITVWAATWHQFVLLTDPVSRLHLPRLCDFVHHMLTESVQLMGATTVGHDDYLQQGCLVNEVAAAIDRGYIMDELRAQTPRLARLRADMDVLRANNFDRVLGALAACAENLYDFVPELFVQSLCDLTTGLNAAINDLLQVRSSLAVPQRITTIAPTGGSDGRAATMEEAYNSYRNRLRESEESARDGFS